MGNAPSTEWRTIAWSNKAKLVDNLKDIQPANENPIRIMLHGPIGAGKSSFINSVNNIFQGRMTHDAHVATGSDTSFTKMKQTHKILKGDGNPHNFCPFMFTDLMGLEERKGIHQDDIKLAMQGHIKDGYKFQSTPISDKDPLYNHEPTPEDKTHVLVSVVPAPTVNILPDVLIEKIKRIRVTASDLGIPHICIITKIDEVSDKLKKDVRNVYKMKVVKEKMETFSDKSTIPMTCIFPVKNYHKEVSLDYAATVNDCDYLVLNALEHIINLGVDVVNQ